jgi:alginate O-acetyltransferase complex protein AlgI
MLFCTQPFAAFFIIIFALYWALPWHRARTYVLLAASFYFYAKWSRELACLIVVSTTIDYWLARGIDASTDPRRRRYLLTVNILGNLSLLCYFKYSNFFLASLSDLLISSGLSESAIRPLKLLLPVGISFYTFEAISYMVDVYRGRIRAERDLAHFQLFILFFPHLVAGPIVRGRDFLPQVGRRKHFSWLRMQLGVQLFLLGMLKKLAIADRMALVADPVFADPAAHSSSALWLATIAYALQVYCDFSGYSDMALGCAHMLGFKLVQNFDMPYLSLSITEFWRRWHMSLGSWLRDYVFIPMGGSRVGLWKTVRNVMVTMTLCGLWHGPSWNFIAWGALQGVLLLGHRMLRGGTDRLPLVDAALHTVPGTIFRWVLTMLSVCLGYIVFRTTSFAATGAFLSGITIPSDGITLSAIHTLSVWLALFGVALFHLLAVKNVWREWCWRLPAPVVGFGCAAAFLTALSLAPLDNKAFIYFQF